MDTRTNPLAEITQTLREALHGERGGNMPVPIADLRVILAALDKADFYAGVLAEIKDMLATAEGVADTPLEAIYNKAAWALDPLADHRRQARAARGEGGA